MKLAQICFTKKTKLRRLLILTRKVLNLLKLIYCVFVTVVRCTTNTNSLLLHSLAPELTASLVDYTQKNLLLDAINLYLYFSFYSFCS